MSRQRGRLLAALCLLVLAPVCAEYISAYDDSTGHPMALLAALAIFVPLYGAPALLIREAARRFGIRWPGILALATGFGILQAGVIDQSMFNDSYRDIGYWHDMIAPTWIEPLGLSVNASLAFVAGHVIWSFCVPIALTEAVGPKPARPWLRLPGLLATVALYLAAAALILTTTLQDEADHASPAQFAGSLALAGLLAVFAFTLGRRHRPRRERWAPAPVLVGIVSLVVSLAFNFQASSVTATVVLIGLLVGTAVVVTRLSGSSSWNSRHVAALATGALLGRVVMGFFAQPLGEVSAAAQLG
ncbi:MAG: hypothetical protein ACRD0P_19140, partial [Stackebrandtia sp.]